MRVLFLSFPYASSQGGGERYTEQVIEGLHRAGHETFLISSSDALLATFKNRGWNAIALWCGLEPVTPLAVLLFPLHAILSLCVLLCTIVWFRFVRKTKVIVCLSLTEKLIATPIAHLLGMNVIWTEHLVAGRSLTLNPYRYWYAACARLAQVVTVSQAAKRALVGVGVPASRIQIIPPGVAPRAAHAPIPEKPVIGAISRLSREKNVALLLEAFALIIKELPEATLEIFGDGPERSSLEALAAKLGITKATTFRGYVERAIDGARFSICIVPSERESFGMTALEVMSCGIPVVATRVGGLPEVIVDGETGMLVPPNDASAMATAALTLLRDKEGAARMGEAGRLRATRVFTEEKMQQAWNQLFS